MAYFGSFGLSNERGLDFVVSFAFVLIFFIFVWYAGTKCESEKERKTLNRLTSLLFLGVALISVLQIVGLFLFFPSIELSLKSDKIIFMPIGFVILFIGMLILNRIGKESLKNRIKS